MLPPSPSENIRNLFLQLIYYVRFFENCKTVLQKKKLEKVETNIYELPYLYQIPSKVEL